MTHYQRTIRVTTNGSTYNMKLLQYFSETTLKDLGQVGGKNASLGEMIQHLQSKGIGVPDGFATTADASWLFLDENNLLHTA